MCRNDQSGIVAMAATLCGSEAAKLKEAMLPAGPALAEVAAAVASFSRCPRFFATSLSCSALAFREAGGSRPRQSEPSSFVLPVGVQGLDAVKILVERLDGPAQRWADTEQACNDPLGYDNNDKCALQQGVCQVRNGAHAEHIAESAAVLQVLRESQPSSRRELVRRQSWCVLHWSALESSLVLVCQDLFEAAELHLSALCSGESLCHARCQESAPVKKATFRDAASCPMSVVHLVT